MASLDMSVSKQNVLVQNACAALQEYKEASTLDLDIHFLEHSKWLLFALKETRKRLRMEESTISNTEESPKCRARNNLVGERSSPLDSGSLMDPTPLLQATQATSSEAPPQDDVPDVDACVEEHQPASTPAVQSTIDDACQHAIDEANKKVGEMKFRDIQKELKARGIPAKGTAEVIRERLLSIMVEDILLKQPAVQPPQKDARDGVSDVKVLPDSTTPGILSPMHTASSAASVKTPAPISTKKANVFGKLLSGGKKMLTAKRTPSKSAIKMPAPQSASRARGSLVPPGPSKAVPHLSPELRAPPREPNSEAVDDTADASLRANDELVEPDTGTSSSDLINDASSMDVGPTESAELAVTHAEARLNAPTSTPDSTDPTFHLPPSSPVTSSPEKPLLSSDTPAVELTAADILAGVQDDGALQQSPATPLASTEHGEPSSPSAAMMPQPDQAAASPLVPEEAEHISTASFSCQGGKPPSASVIKAAVSVKQAVVLKPSSHAMKLEQIREKQKAANLQKDKERQEREADREQRIQAQKERAMKEKIMQKQVLKQKAEKTLEDYHGPTVMAASDAPEIGEENHVAPPPAPVVAPTPVPAAIAPSALAPAKLKPMLPMQVVSGATLPSAASTAAKISASIHKGAEVEAQQRADLAAKQAAADEFDSYCMSEPEEQEQDNSDEDEQRGKASKRVPSWANKDSLRAALKQQAELKIDPDAIFFECNTCSLEEIFERSSKRYQKRTSSANWTVDQLSFYENISYKRSVGIIDA